MTAAAGYIYIITSPPPPPPPPARPHMLPRKLKIQILSNDSNVFPDIYIMKFRRANY